MEVRSYNWEDCADVSEFPEDCKSIRSSKLTFNREKKLCKCCSSDAAVKPGGGSADVYSYHGTYNFVRLKSLHFFCLKLFDMNF